MKPAKFDYHDPTSIEEALGLMAQFGDQARPLAGGQSLVPLMNFRLIRPAHLIDLNGVSELSYLRADDAALRIGATTRQRELERSPEVAKRWPLLRDAAAFIGHIQIRNRGTVGGSLAHAFPSAELPVALVTLGASFVLRSRDKRRTIAAGERRVVSGSEPPPRRFCAGRSGGADRRRRARHDRTRAFDVDRDDTDS